MCAESQKRAIFIHVVVFYAFLPRHVLRGTQIYQGTIVPLRVLVVTLLYFPKY